jgi:hypothetical protein
VSASEQHEQAEDVLTWNGPLARAYERALVAGALTHRAAARHFVRRHRRDAGYLGWVLRSVAASSALAIALLGLAAAPASANLPAFGALTGAANPLDGLSVIDSSSPALGDYDGDGDLDLVAGEDGGIFVYFRNQGSATSPVFVRISGVADPLDGENVGAASAPGAGDLDGDGDLDLATGRSDGSFAVHYFPEPGRGLLLGAGITLLSGLERVRRRERAQRGMR